MLEGRASGAGTRRYAERMAAQGLAERAHYRNVGGLSCSSVGLGTYLGDSDAKTDALYEEAFGEALSAGCNVVDSAINYRFQRSERSIGAALSRCAAAGVIRRDEVVVSTKGGYVPFDGSPPRTAEEFSGYLEKTFFGPGVCRPEEMACGGQHCMSPKYLDHQLSQSLSNLRLSCVDVYFVHNPEGQIPETGREVFEQRLRAAFELLEERAADGKIAVYGTATWNGYRMDPRSKDYLPLERLLALAREVGGEGHHFRAIQLPYNLAMPEAFGLSNQGRGERWVSTLQAAADLGLAVYASASLLQSRLSVDLPPAFKDQVPGDTDAQRAIEFVRSTPGITVALVGMKQAGHVRENLALARRVPLNASRIAALFQPAA